MEVASDRLVSENTQAGGGGDASVDSLNSFQTTLGVWGLEEKDI